MQLVQISMSGLNWLCIPMTWGMRTGLIAPEARERSSSDGLAGR